MVSCSECKWHMFFNNEYHCILAVINLGRSGDPKLDRPFEEVQCDFWRPDYDCMDGNDSA